MPEQRLIGYQWNFCPWPTATSERENSTLVDFTSFCRTWEGCTPRHDQG